MYIVIVPVLFLIIISICKKIPLIGGRLLAAFFGAGILAMVLGGVCNPVQWINPWIDGLNRVAFIIWIVIFGSCFSMLQIETGAMQTVLNVLRALFGHTPQGLVLAVLLALYMGGSMLGTVAAVGAVIGMLIVPALDDMGLSPELICATIVTGGSMGAIMPPISNAVNVAAGIIGIDPMPVIQISYITVGIGLVFISLFFCKVYIGKRYSMPAHLIPQESAAAILKREWKTLIPLAVLIVIIMINSIPAIAFDVPGWLLKQIPFGEGNFYQAFKKIKIVGTLTNNIVLSLLISIAVSYVMYPKLRVNAFEKLLKAFRNVQGSVMIQIAAGFFLGAFTIGGQLDVIAAWAAGLNATLLKMGGSASLVLAGMIMGAQSTSQTLLTPIIGPSWIAAGVTPVHAAVASAHLAAAGQGLPPADLNTFVIAGLVASILQKKVDPLKSMYYTTVYCIYLFIVGVLFLYI